MEACVESVFPRWITSVFSRERADTGPSLPKPSIAAREPMPRFAHVSLDSFFASVEQQLNPKLQGKPALVGRSKALSASNEAVLAGVKPGAAMDAALLVCPAAVVVEGRFGCYAEYAERVREILAGFTSNVECGPAGDFYLDFAGAETQFPDPRGTLLRLQLEILNQLGLSASVGAGSTRAIAATASQVEGPRGFRMVSRGAEQGFLAKLPTRYLPGINADSAAELSACEVNNVGDLARVPRAALESAFGKHSGSDIWNRARGRDWDDLRRRLQPGSISREMTIDGGTQDGDELRSMIGYLCERVSFELCCTRREATTFGLAIRYVDCFAAQQSMRVSAPGGKLLRLHEPAEELLHTLFTRRLGVEFIAVNVATRPAADTAHFLAVADLPLAANQ